MAATPTVGSGPLRSLRWPDMPAVDLLSEFSWIVASDGEFRTDEELPGMLNDLDNEKRMERPRAPASLTLEDGQRGPCASVSQPSSPYKQRLLPDKAVRSPLSPAQRAGKKIAQLKTELQQIVASNSSTTRRLPADASGWQHGTSPHRLSREGGIPQAHSGDKMVSSSLSSATSPSKIRAKVKRQRSRSPRSKTRGPVGPPTPAEQDLREKQERLAAWLLKNASHDRVDGHVQRTTNYSIEVDARVRAAVSCKDDESGRNDALWVDPVRSLLAAEVTSESVLGGFVPTRRLAFDPATESSENVSPVDTIAAEAASTDHTCPAASPLPAIDFAAERSLDIQRIARQQVAVGDITDALATLDAGIHQLLHEFQDNHEELRLAGFNYSVAAHQFATKLQLQYRRRHRERVRSLVVLQRAWRHFRQSSRSRSTSNYDDAYATTIQRVYKRRYRQIVDTSSAQRIQRCFRVYQSQKHILHFHQACRLLLQRERRQRELERLVLLRKQRMWVRLKVVLRVLRLWKMRRDSITSLQKRWKGGRCRVQYGNMLSKLRLDEAERRRREDAFASERMDAIVGLYREFLCNTRRGRTLVKQHAELPWIRFRHLRGKKDRPRSWAELSTEERIHLLDRMYNGRKVGGWEWRVMARELSLVHPDQQGSRHCGQVTVSLSSLEFLTSSTASGATNKQTPDDGTIVSPSKNPRALTTKMAVIRQQLVNQAVRVQTKMSTAVTHASWRIVHYPKAYYWHHRLLTRRARSHTRLRLEEDFKRCAAGFMRTQFRRVEGNRPRYECEACYEPFATTAELTQHSRGTTTTGAACSALKSRASLEWRAVEHDVDSLHSRQRYHGRVWKQIMSRLPPWKRLPRLEGVDISQLGGIRSVRHQVQVCDCNSHSHWSFAGFRMTKRLAHRVQRQTGRVSIQRLVDLAVGIVQSIGPASPIEFSTTEVPCELVGYVLQALGGLDLDDEELDSEVGNDAALMLARTALYQLVQWSPSRIRSQAVPADRLDVGGDGAIGVDQLLSLVDNGHHRSVKALIATTSKRALDRCNRWVGSWRKRSVGRATTYQPGVTRQNPSSRVDIGPTVTHQDAAKRVGQHVGLGSAATPSPSTVVPVTT